MEYIKVGNIVNTFGIRGELKILSLTDFEDERFKKGGSLYVKYQNKYDKLVVKTVRVHKGFLLVSFEGLDNINYVEKYKSFDIFVSKNDIKKLDEGEYYFFDLVGLDAYCQDKLIGKVTKIETGFQNVLRIEANEKDILVPYVDAFIKNVDLENKKIEINYIEGLL